MVATLVPARVVNPRLTSASPATPGACSSTHHATLSVEACPLSHQMLPKAFSCGPVPYISIFLLLHARRGSSHGDGSPSRRRLECKFNLQAPQ